MKDLAAIAGKILGAMRYCYLPLSTEVNEEEWRGDAESGGAKDYIISLFHDEIKKAYRIGYKAGTIRAVASLARTPDDANVLSDCEIYSERDFQEWQKN